MLQIVRGGTVKSYYFPSSFLPLFRLEDLHLLEMSSYHAEMRSGKKKKGVMTPTINCTLSDLVLVLLSSSLGAKGEGVKLKFVMFSQLSRIGSSR